MVGYPIWIVFFRFENITDLLFIHFCIALFMNIALLINIKETHFSLPRLLIILTLMLKKLKLHIRFIKLIGIIIFAFIGIGVIYAFTPINFDLLSVSEQISFLLIILLAFVLIILEVRTDSIKRYSYQFLFWSFLFILSFLFSVFQINDYLIVVSDDIAIPIMIAIVGILFNFAQLLSSARNMFEAVYKIVEQDYNELIESSAYKFDDLVTSMLDFTVKQRIFRDEVKEQIRELGLKATITKFLPFLVGYTIMISVIFSINYTQGYIESFFEMVLDYVGWVWVSLWGGDKKVATLMGALAVVFYFFFKNLIFLINNFKLSNLRLRIELAGRVLVGFLLIFILIIIAFNQLSNIFLIYIIFSILILLIIIDLFLRITAK
jgi:hypothetical protein